MDFGESSGRRMWVLGFIIGLGVNAIGVRVIRGSNWKMFLYIFFLIECF